jgi:hypothetical protein
MGGRGADKMHEGEAFYRHAHMREVGMAWARCIRLPALCAAEGSSACTRLQAEAEAASGRGWRRDAQLRCVVRMRLYKVSRRGDTAPKWPHSGKVHNTCFSASGSMRARGLLGGGQVDARARCQQGGRGTGLVVELPALGIAAVQRQRQGQWWLVQQGGAREDKWA